LTWKQNYHKDLYPYRILKPLLGQGLVTNVGESWLQQRRLMQPAFHRKLLAAFGTLMTDATVTMLDQWQRLAERDQPLDVAAEMLRLTLRIAGQALFNIDLSDESHRVFVDVSRDVDIPRHICETITEFMDEFSQPAGEFTTSSMEMLPWPWWQPIDR
jgi:cytochrome P450